MSVNVKWNSRPLITEIDNKSDKLVDIMAQDLLTTASNIVPEDTGKLKSSLQIRNDNQNKSASVGSSLDYSLIIEYGTRNQQAQPYLRPAIDNLNVKISGMINQVSSR